MFFKKNLMVGMMLCVLFVFQDGLYATGFSPDEKLNWLLWRAVICDEKEIEKTLNEGADIEQIDENGNSILNRVAPALYRDDLLEKARLLLKYGGDVNSQNNEGKTPLSSAMRFNSPKVLEAAKLFIENGADVNAKDSEGRTPLFKAVALYSSPALEVVKVLIENGAEINVKDAKGQTPLFAAINRRAPEVAKFLIENGALINVKDAKGRTPLFAAVKNCGPEVAKFLIESGAEVNVKDYKGKTPLFFAAALYFHAPESIKLLVEHGADVNEKNFDGATPIYKAIFSVHLDNINTLIDLGADLNTVDNDGLSLLHSMLLGLPDEEFEKMSVIFRGRDVDFNAEALGFTPLHLAASTGLEKAVQILLEYGADKNRKNCYGDTPVDSLKKSFETIPPTKDIMKIRENILACLE